MLWSAEHVMKRVLKTVLIWPDLSKQKALVMREQCECSSVQNDSVTLCEVVAFFPVWFQFTQKHDWIFTHMIGESFRRCTCFGLVVNEISLSGGYKRFGRNNCLRLQGWLCKNSADNIPNLHGHENKVRFFFQILMRHDIWNHFYTLLSHVSSIHVSDL